MSNDALAERLGRLLLARSETVALAESCTGGMISAALTDVPGSSAWFGYGFVTYSNQAKQHLLGVRAGTLAEAGAVSERTVREMALGAQRSAQSDWAIAVSGIAGPGGGGEDKPVGLVWLAIAGPHGRLNAWRCQFDGGREAVRRQTVEMALQTLCRLLEAPDSVV